MVAAINGAHKETTFDDLIPDWQERLKNRIILNSALAAKWYPGKWYEQEGWYYPLFRADGKPWMLPDGRTAQRWKNYKSSEQPHSSWGYVGQGKDDVKKPVGCDYYWLPGGDVTQQIAAADGTIYVTCGEPDMLSIVEAGKRNVVSFFGEGNIPHNLAEAFERLGVKRVVYYPDNDNPGWDAAQLLFTLLENSDIKFEAYRLPLEVDGTPVKDVNDLWVAVWGETETFWQKLGELKPIIFLKRREIVEPNREDHSAAWDKYHEEIERALKPEYKRNSGARGWSKFMTCIFGSHDHDDKKPAAGWHFEKHIYRCFKCQQTWYADDVADRLGIKRPEFNATEKPRATATAQSGSNKAPEPPKAIYTSDDSLRRYVERLDGANASECAPIPFPYRVLHESVRALRPGKLMGVVGVSGGGKTSFVECLNDPWRQMGFHSVWWGPEWTWEEMADRTIQRYGGASMTDMMMHEMWLAEEADGVELVRRLGTQLPPEIVTKSKELAASIQSWPGKVYYVDQMDVDIDQLLGMVTDMMTLAQEQHGRRIRIAVFDYAQLLSIKGARSDGERINAVLGRIKAFCSDNRLVGVVASQVTKSASKNQKEEDMSISAEDAQYMRDDKFNLMMTLNPVYDNNGAVTNVGKINIVKNSYGKKKEYPVGIDLARLRWLDKAAGSK